VFHLLQLEPKFWNAVLTYCEQQVCWKTVCRR